LVASSLDARQAQIHGLDFGLIGGAAAIAAYSAGEGLHEPTIGLVFVFGILIGTIASYLVQRMIPVSKVGLIGGVLYVVAVLAAVILALPLNRFLPADGFPRELAMAGVLCWMLFFGSFGAWRDGTMLFQAVPCIALFGMVGSWDTFAYSPVMFFAFLLCIATLFARTHLRAMARQAVAAGVRDVQELQGSAWRWMAGPEWGLLSAASIVLISVIGAPILQESVKGVSENFNINVPLPANLRQNRFSQGNQSGRAQIGRGPNENLQHIELFLASLDRPRYLRTEIFQEYTTRDWIKSREYLTPGALQHATTEIKNPRLIRFEVQVLRGAHRRLPIPGEVVSLEGGLWRKNPDGTYYTNPPATQGAVGRGAAIVAAEGSIGETAERQPDFGPPGLPRSVMTLAHDVTRNAPNDWEKAMAIKREIESRCVYNLDAAAIPPNLDPVEVFLFQTREGYCDLFASAMTTLAQAAGMRARYVIGFFPIEGKMQDGKYVIHDTDYHAWCEIFFKDLGWVVFDATEGARQIEGAERGSSVHGPWYTNKLIVAPALGLGAIAFAWFALPGLSSLFRRRVRSARNAAHAEATRLYWQFSAMLERKSGKPKRLSQTPAEYLQSVQDRLGSAADLARTLNTSFVAALYGPEVTQEQLDELRSELRKLRTELRHA
jgi:transglutaminase-like putative cysteine protease